MASIINIMKNDWLQISVVTFMVAMLICGYYKGLVKMSSNMVSLVLSVILTKSIRPYLQNWIINNDYIKSYVNNRIQEKLAANLKNIPDSSVLNDQMLKDSLTNQVLKSYLETDSKNTIENFYELIGLDKITELISDKVTEFVLSVVTFILLLIVITILIKFLFKILDKIADLPVLTAFNRTSGSILGLAEAVLYIWIIFIVISLLPQDGIIASASEQLNREGTWIWYMKEANIFIKIFELIIT